MMYRLLGLLLVFWIQNIIKRDAIKQAIQIAENSGIDSDVSLRLVEDNYLNNSEAFFELEIVITTILNAILAGYSE